MDILPVPSSAASSPLTPSYFDDPLSAKKLYDEASSWIGTPFREYYEQDIEAGRKELAVLMPHFVIDVKGPAGGIDCIGFVQEVFYRIGAVDKFTFHRDPADYQSHQLGEKVLDWLRGKQDDNQSKLLAAILTEIELPGSDLPEIPDNFCKPGDILVLRHGPLFHLPVIIDHARHFLNALPRLGVVQGTIQDHTFARHLQAIFRMRPTPEMTKAATLELQVPIGYRVRVTDLPDAPLQRWTGETWETVAENLKT
jgi:cell wall-associated NlpC family hydrolase